MGDVHIGYFSRYWPWRARDFQLPKLHWRSLKLTDNDTIGYV